MNPPIPPRPRGRRARTSSSDGTDHRPPGLRCPVCQGQQSWVLDSRYVPEFECVRRRRTCMDCGQRYSTRETVVVTGGEVAAELEWLQRQRDNGGD